MAEALTKLVAKTRLLVDGLIVEAGEFFSTTAEKAENALSAGVAEAPEIVVNLDDSGSNSSSKAEDTSPKGR